jgi:ATP-dependent DNA helicase PIF1
VAIIASAGTGKTAFVHAAVQDLQRQQKKVRCIAASALAATLLPNGRTAHASLRIPIEIDSNSYCRWDLQEQDRIRLVDVIFWDEISMVSFDAVNCVDRSLRRLMSNDLLFGGKVMVLLGDFRQLAPVVKRHSGEHYSILHAEWFQMCKRFRFTRNFRSSDTAFQRQLMDIGDGIVDEVVIPPSAIVSSINDLIDKVFGDNIANATSASNMILAFTLDQCQLVNDAVLAKFPSSPSYSIATDDLRECKSPDEYPPEYVSSLIIHGVPPSSLTLQKNARYMIVRNAAPPGICNGIQALLLSHTRYMCNMRLISGPGQGKTIYLPRFSYKVTTANSGLPFTFIRRQFPLIPAYCVSVHKSQGQSLNMIGIVAEKDAFAHGQVYVAMSRVGSWRNIAFHSPRGESFLKNKVAKELIALQLSQ